VHNKYLTVHSKRIANLFVHGHIKNETVTTVQ